MESIRPTAAAVDAALCELAENSRALLDRAQQRLAATATQRREELAALESQLTTQVDELQAQVAAELAHDRTAAQAELDLLRAAFAAETAEWGHVRDEIEASLAARELAVSQCEAELEPQFASIAQQRATLDELLSNATTDQERLAQLAADLERAPTQPTTSASELRLAAELAQLTAECESLQTQVAELSGLLTLAEDEAKTATLRATALSEEHELQGRELAHLQAECEALAVQLADATTAAPLAGADSNRQDAEELADLRVRFELAVTDLRELREEKRALEAELKSRPAVLGATPAPAGNDWESQKRRLLASLEDEFNDRPQHSEERATIEGAIRITDEVLADKQRQIEALEAQLAAADQSAASSLSATSAGLFDQDEAILAERERIATLRAEWEVKLRAAELELSVERAKIAREQSELAQWRLELESLRDSLSSAAATPSTPDGRKQRRWLDKLGLSGQE